MFQRTQPANKLFYLILLITIFTWLTNAYKETIYFLSSKLIHCFIFCKNKACVIVSDLINRITEIHPFVQQEIRQQLSVKSNSYYNCNYTVWFCRSYVLITSPVNKERTHPYEQSFLICTIEQIRQLITLK